MSANVTLDPVQPEPSDQYVQSFARGLSVIRSFDAEHARMTLAEMAERTGLTRATARRFLLTLVDLGYVATDGRLFSLTPRVLELGFSYLSSLTLPELATPHLEELSRSVNESTSASVLDGAEIVYVARVPTRRIMNVAITIGTRFPAGLTSMGRVLLANLPPARLELLLAELPAPDALRATLGEVREQGWALVDGELEAGLRSIAAPIRRADGTVIAAINVSTTASTATLDRIRTEFTPLLLETAARISAAVAQSGTR